MERATYSYNTAMRRSKPSAPAKWLHDTGRLPRKGNPNGYTALDYGCGRGRDATEYGMSKYDPYWYDVCLGESEYDVVLMTYVLNVLRSREDVLNTLIGAIQHVKAGGWLYITVRRGLKNEGETSMGYQYNVELPYPVVKKTASYVIYGIHVPKTEIMGVK